MMKLLNLILLLGSLLGSTVGCAQSANPTTGQTGALTVEVLYSTDQCGLAGSQPTARWIDNSQGLTQIYQGFPVLPPLQPPPLDFSRSGVVLISMGQRPTAGYGLSLAEGYPQLKGDTLEIRVDWWEPKPGMLQAQIITTPCLLLKIPVVPFQRLSIIDQTGQVRLSASR